MNADEAWEVIQQGGVVTSGGYTYAKDIYFAWGTYPLCVRGGDVDPRAKCHADKEWEQLSFKESALRNGYSPDYGSYYDNLWKDDYDEKRALGDWLKSKMTVKDYINPQKNAAMCKIWYEQGENNE